MRARRTLGSALCAFAVLSVTPVAPGAIGEATAQVGSRAGTSRLLRQAAALEASGDLAGAERALREVLAEESASTGALIGLERVLRAQDRPGEILPILSNFVTRNPSADGARRLHVQVLLEMDSLEAAKGVGDAWMAHDPSREATYRDLSTLYEESLGFDAAYEVLRRGRSELEDDALALETGDLLARSGALDEAVREWTRGVGDDGAQVGAVARRLRNLGPDADRHLGRALQSLSESRIFARRRSAALLALELRREENAERLARTVSDELGQRARAGFLEQVAERASELGLSSLAAWAYDELGEEANTPAERRAFDDRLVEASLASGDTASAAEVQWRIVESFPVGSDERRLATLRALRLAGAVSPPEEIREALDAFSSIYPEAPELDETAAEISLTLQARGHIEAAAAVLERVNGPRSALERGYLSLAEGEVEGGRTGLMEALSGLPPAEATGTIRLVSLLGRVSPAAAEALARAAWSARKGEVVHAVALIEDAASQGSKDERASLLAHGARLAEDAGDAAEAARLRTSLVTDHPDTDVASEAAVALARYHANRENDVQRAIEILEDMLERRPNDAIAPNARVELSRLRGAP